MMKVPLLAALVAVSAAQQCCMPRQWTGGYGSATETVVNGKGMVRNLGGFIAYDLDSQLLSVTTDLVEGSEAVEKNHTIFNYNTMTMYHVYVFRGQEQCDVMALTEPMMEACVPDDARRVNTLEYGSPEDRLEVAVYQIQRSDFQATLTTTPLEECYPVTEGISGNMNGVTFLTSVEFNGLEPDISDRSVFDPPPLCEGRAKVEGSVRFNSFGIPRVHH